MKKPKPISLPKSEMVEAPGDGDEIEESPNPKAGELPGKTPRRFSIVGIGASAGGLEALDLFLKNVPPRSGMAFVIIQHLDPTHKGIMVELLQRATTMHVIQVSDHLKVEADCVYVIPPNKDMSILHGVLFLLDPAAPRGLRLPIDYFFRALADDQKERSIGVILSGMGSDGSLGLRAIKEKAGVVFVQEPSSAKFDGMPRSAIDAGLADVVAPVEEIPGKISAYLRHLPFLSHSDVALESKTQSALEKVFILLRTQTGHDFSLYKKSTIYRRVERRMGIHQIDRIAHYVRLLQENPNESELLFKELLIGVTSFFRDPEAWEQLKNQVIPEILAGAPAGGVLRAWTPGCSTGEEAYSLAMVFKEGLEQVRPMESYHLQIFATDLDRDAIDKARVGVYPANIAADVSPERLRRFFVQDEHGFRVGKEIREMVIFAPQNLVMDPPFTKLDLMVCRNLLIYLAPELQKKLLPLFYYSLNPGGFLFLGSAETIGGQTDLFHALEGKTRLYRRLDSKLKPGEIEFPTEFFPGRLEGQPGEKNITTDRAPFRNLQALADQIVLQRFAPAAVLTNDRGDILYISGRTGKYLEPAAGKANWNIFAMAREGLRYELTSSFHKALREKTAVTHKNLVVGTNGGRQALNVTVEPLSDPEGLRGMVMVVFDDVETVPTLRTTGKKTPISADDVHIAQIELLLQRAAEELQTTREEMQTSQEELKSTNEELQSTNEELTTSKEEMQSLNEELQTVNHELQARVDELSRSNNDMKNLLNSTDIATLFLDNMLNVRRFSSQASQFINLIPGDVGRPITDMASELLFPELPKDVEEVLRTLVSRERPVVTRDGRWFTVRIMPYRTLDNRIDGVVITFIDISVAKRLEAVLRDSEHEMKSLIQHMTNAFALFESEFDTQRKFINGRFIFANDAFEHITGATSTVMHGKTMYDVWSGAVQGWVEASGQVVMSGEPAGFEMYHAATKKMYHCNIYRPGESRQRFCVVFEEKSAAA